MKVVKTFVIILILSLSSRVIADNPWGIHSQAFSDIASFDSIKALGTDWTLKNFFWKDIQPTSGNSFVWTHYDSIATEANDDSLNVIGMLGEQTPGWASAWSKELYPPVDSSLKNLFPPKNTTDWYNFVYNVVKRYPTITHWIIWNEPNGFICEESKAYPPLNGLVDSSKAIYYRDSLLKVGYNAADSANSNCKVFCTSPGTDVRFLGRASFWAKPLLVNKEFSK